jgi:tRNA A-37 threonylcarbamoyl transferase component Bud32
MSDMMDRIASALSGRYDLEREAGQGGMATVYLAHDVKHDRRVALKVLQPEVASFLGSDRFLQEIRIAAQLQHPNILTLHESGEADGFLYYAMPFVDGESLRELLHRAGPLDLGTAASINAEVADALTYAHRKGIIHRDIKPGNILLSQGHAIVADFGIAKAVSTAGGEPLTQTGFPLGTPGYMSPEQAAGTTRLDEKTDVYSLACVFYEMVVGEVPDGWLSDEASRTSRFVKATPEHRRKLDDLPGGVEPALVRAMAMDTDHRFATPNEFADALRKPAPDTRKYQPDEVRQIVGSAADLQARDATREDAMSIGGVRRLAAEVDIPTKYVREAARAVDRPRAPAVPGARVMGVPVTYQVEQTLEGEVPPPEYGGLLDIVRESFGQRGELDATLDRAFSWTTGEKGKARVLGRVTSVDVTPRNGETRIKVEEDETTLIGGSMGIGALVVGQFAFWLTNTDITAWALVGPAAAVFIGGAQIWKVHRRKRQAFLSGVADRLARHVSATALLPRPE